MNKQTENPVDWAPEQSVTERQIAARRINVEGLLAQLKDAPGKWAVYSKHKTRGAARQRVYSLRESASYKEYPLEWATAKEEPGVKDSPVQVLVRWREDAVDTQNEG